MALCGGRNDPSQSTRYNVMSQPDLRVLMARLTRVQVRVQQDRCVQYRGSGHYSTDAKLHSLLSLPRAEHGWPPRAHVGHDGTRQSVH